MSGRVYRFLASWWLAAAVAACASRPPVPPAPPLLRLAPASLGMSLSLRQQLTIEAGGRTVRAEMALEVDEQAVRMALLEMGQVVARLEWDGVELFQQRVPHGPKAVSAERILSDVQLVYWPLAAIAPELPPGWHLSAQAGERTLYQGAQARVKVRYPQPEVAELEHLGLGYRVRIQSRSWEIAP